MAALANFTENKLIDHTFRAIPYTAPETLYIGLLTGAPSDTGGGIEVSGNAYARVAVTSGVAAWKSTNGTTSGASTGTNGTTSNAAAINFPTPTPSGWGTVTHFGIFDAATAGNLLIYAALGQSKVINPGDAVSFAVDALTFQIDN